jgi:hypothetical protein
MLELKCLALVYGERRNPTRDDEDRIREYRAMASGAVASGAAASGAVARLSRRARIEYRS